MRLAFTLLVLGIALALLVLNHDAGEVFGLDSNDFARMIIGATFAMTIGAGLLRRYHGAFGEAFRTMLFWIAAFVVIIAGYGYKEELTAVGQRVLSELVPGMAVETGTPGEIAIARARDGHFYVKATADGGDIRFVVDTGATSVVLTDADARKAGIDPSRLSYDLEVSTANGRTRTAETLLGAIRIGEVEVTRVRAMVARPGQLETSLLGNTFLSRLKSFTVEGSRLTMRQ